VVQSAGSPLAWAGGQRQERDIIIDNTQPRSQALFAPQEERAWERGWTIRHVN
jgi:hypothetical protein